MDVHKEKQQLTKEIEQFDKHKNNELTNIEKEKTENEKFKKEKQQLILVAKKLKLEQIKLDKQKEELEKEQLKNINIDDLINLDDKSIISQSEYYDCGN